jgi:hypothetical protein
MQKIFYRAGAVCYVIWGLLHLQAARKVYALGSTLDQGMLQGRVYQDAWNLVYFAVFAIVVAVVFNWKNSRWGYWLNLITVSVTDIGFIIMILVPGYLPFFPGVLGPVFWVVGAALTTIGLRERPA